MIPSSFRQLCIDLDYNPKIYYTKGGQKKVWDAWSSRWEKERAQPLADHAKDECNKQQLMLPGIGF